MKPMLMRIMLMMKPSNCSVTTMLKIPLRKSPLGRSGARSGCTAATSFCTATQLRCSGVRNTLLPSCFSFISLNLSMVTPTKRFMTKKLPTMMNTTKNTHMKGSASRTGCASTPTASTPSYMIPSHISRVAISKRVSMLAPMLSKLLRLLSHLCVMLYGVIVSGKVIMWLPISHHVLLMLSPGGRMYCATSSSFSNPSRVSPQ
mmetsp:Transcript_58368/g.186050  ORF Transcript_58368/g.186050 Transcript_58368/m.186050 type:complete len:203 (-) Transcript_58368:3460-4068(-)